jgi:hypothetical protein
VNVRGLQLGGTITITVDGDDLGKSPRLLLPFPAKQTLKPGSTDKQATFEVEPDGQTPPGYYQLRVVTDGGVSLPVIVGVDALPQRPFAAEAGAIPVALHGTVGGSAVLETAFAGKAGQHVMVEVEAQRFGSKLRPVVHLYGPRKLQLAWSWGTPALLGDTRLEATLPEDGTYVVTLHDAEYATPGPGFFRLKIGQWQYADQTFPPVVAKDAKSIELLGPGEPVRLDLPATRNPFEPLPWPKGQLWSGPRPFAEVSPRPEFVAPLGAEPLPAGPFAINGRFLKPGEEDRYRIPVTPGTRVRFEVFAERLGSPVDAALVVRNESGVELARAEDGPGTLDPVLEFAVPDKVNVVVVGVLGVPRRGHAGSVYRLTVDPLQGVAKTPDFRLFTPVQRVSLPAGGRALVPVYADRQGDTGPIDLTADGLPAGVKLDRNQIPAGADGVLVTVTRGDETTDAGIVGLRGRGEGGMERPVFLRGHPLERLQPWLAAEIAVAPTSAADFAIDWRPLPQAAILKPAGRYSLPVRVTRTDAAAPVRLTLLTSQPPILVNNQPDPNRSIRAEKPVELGAKVEVSELTALFPPELPADAYDLAVQAELLSPDKQRVLATAFTPVRRVPVRLPVSLALTSPTKIEAKLDPKTGANVEITGEVVRAEGVSGDVVVALTGLPPGIPVNPVTVKAGETKFTVKVTLPPTAPPGELSGVKLSASVAPDPKQPNVRVKSRDVELTLLVQAVPK